MEEDVDPYSLERAQPSTELGEFIRNHYDIDIRSAVDLGGSYNLNLHAGNAVIRVYQPYVSVERLSGIQQIRRQLTAQGIPCIQVIPAKDGRTCLSMGDRVLEVERFVEGADKMDTWERLGAGLPWLGRIHTLLRNIDAGEEVRKAPVANHVEAEQALDWTLKGTQFIRDMQPTPDEISFAEDAEKLANLLKVLEQEFIGKLPRQLVHGDFWYGNVFIRHGQVVHIGDFDFMGERARIDDLALTLFFANMVFMGENSLDERINKLRPLVDAYDSGLEDHLSGAERAELPLAMARTLLCFVGIIAFLDKRYAQEEIAMRHNDLRWALELAMDFQRWQDSFV